MTSESAPRSSKKCASRGTCSTCSVITSAAGTSRRVTRLGWLVAGADRSAVRIPAMTSHHGTSQGHVKAAQVRAAVWSGSGDSPRPLEEQVLAVEVLQPVGLVDGVEVTLAEVGRDGHRGEVLAVVPGQPAHGATDHRAGGAAEQEPAAGEAVAGPDGVHLLDTHDLVDVRLVEHRRTHAHAQTGDHPAARCVAEGHRAGGVDSDDPHGPVPLTEVARAAHQGPRGAGPDEQHVQLRELRAIAGAVLR